MTENSAPDVTIPVTIPAHYAARLSALISPDAGMPDLEAVIFELIDHAQQGVARPGSWEREWVCQVFGYDWLARVATGAPGSGTEGWQRWLTT